MEYYERERELKFYEEYTSMDNAYADLLKQIQEKGDKFGPRGKSCIECRPASFCITRPQLSLYTGLSRKLNYRFFAVETLLYLAGIGDQRHADLILAVNPNMKFALNQKSGHFDGPYGPALLKSLLYIEELLKQDPHTRQAVASIWSPGLGRVTSGTKDLPCTCMLHFFTEKSEWCDHPDVLSMSVYMRSNDLNWGTPYDVPAFATILIAMAGGTNMPVGRYYHVAGSLHYYETGGSDGERPPKIDDYKIERWHPDLIDMPMPTSHVSLVTVKDDALNCTNNMYRHVVDGKSLATFVQPRKMCPLVEWLVNLMWLERKGDK